MGIDLVTHKPLSIRKDLDDRKFTPIHALLQSDPMNFQTSFLLQDTTELSNIDIDDSMPSLKSKEEINHK